MPLPLQSNQERELTVAQESIFMDLQESGLVPQDIQCREPQGAELAATGTPLTDAREFPCYVIPYYDIEGIPVPFYRIKFIGRDPKYIQMRKSSNFIYFPKRFSQTLNGQGYVVVTEGEKKACLTVKLGVPACALGGVDSWSNRSIMLPEGTELIAKKQGTQAKLPSGGRLMLDESSSLAMGLNSLIELIISRRLVIVVIYDSDRVKGLTYNVAAAAAKLGYEFRFRGVPTSQVKHLVLPSYHSVGDKVGLDDFLVARGIDALKTLIQGVLNKANAFPRHPNPKGYLNSRLQVANITRKESADLGLAILAELDASGMRIREQGSGELYYFHQESKKLMHVVLSQGHKVPLHETPFGSLLYSKFGIGQNDARVLGWLASQYTGELGLMETVTHRVMTFIDERRFAFQLSDAQFAVISDDPKNPIEIVDNGTYDILFESGMVEPLDGDEVLELFMDHNTSPKKPLTPLWSAVFEGLNVNDREQIPLMTLLFYVSPWFLRWRGTQLPIELMVGEAGSGKTSIYALRQTILRGKTNLSNFTSDIRDWYSSIVAGGGVHVLDNVHFTSGHKDLRQRLSDEYCRLVTEPQPHIELRKLFTTKTLHYSRVNNTFALTSIEQPFYNADLLQRAIVMELRAVGTNHDSFWVDHQLNRFQGRKGAVAHHLLVIHRFLRMAIHEGMWSNTYRANNRLANLEQCISIMGKVFAIPTVGVFGKMDEVVKEAITEADWVLQGLKEYASHMRSTNPSDFWEIKFKVVDVSEWAATHATLYTQSIITNARRLGKYFIAHAQDIKKITGIVHAPGKAHLYSVQSIERGL